MRTTDLNQNEWESMGAERRKRDWRYFKIIFHFLVTVSTRINEPVRTGEPQQQSEERRREGVTSQLPSVSFLRGTFLLHFSPRRRATLSLSLVEQQESGRESLDRTRQKENPGSPTL